MDGEGGAAGLVVYVADVLFVACFEDRLGGEGFSADDDYADETGETETVVEAKAEAVAETETEE